MVGQPIDGAAVQRTATARPSAFVAPSPEAVDAWHAAGIANGGTSIEDPPGIRDAALRQALPRLSARSRRQQALRLAPDSGGRVSLEIVEREQGARRAAAGRQASVGRYRHRHDLFDLPAAAGGRRGQAAGGLVSVGAHLHPRQRHREGRVSRRLRRARPDLRRAGHQPARRGRAAMRRNGISARARASTSMRREDPWAAHYRMWSYVTRGTAGAGRGRVPGRHGRGRRSPAIRWAGTAR